MLALIDEETQSERAQDDARRPAAERIVLACGSPLLRGLGVRLLEARLAGPASVAIGVEPLRERPDLHLPGGALAVVRTLLRETVGPDVGVTLLA